MEIKKYTNSLTVTNTFSHELTVIVEYLHYVEIVPPMSRFRVEVKANDELNLLSMFDIEYAEETVVVALNNRTDTSIVYDVEFFLDDVSMYRQTLGC